MIISISVSINKTSSFLCNTHYLDPTNPYLRYEIASRELEKVIGFYVFQDSTILKFSLSIISLDKVLWYHV